MKKLEYYYEGAENGRWYGIRDLDEVLESGKSPIVVCPNYENMYKYLKIIL